MTGRFTSTYSGLVVNANDPLRQNRIYVRIPALAPAFSAAWAMPVSSNATPPAVGSAVTIQFERGNLAYPLWSAVSSTKFSAQYNGVVVNNLDPEQLGRVLVQIPSLQPKFTTAWALPSTPPATSQIAGFTVPSINSTVRISFLNGDLADPVWSFSNLPAGTTVPARAAGATSLNRAPAFWQQYRTFIQKLPR
jgi:Type VI secretion system/phage-baseplate injector OB domain